MKDSSSTFNKFTKQASALVEIATSLAVCCKVYALSQSVLYGILAYPALLVVHAVFTYIFFIKELTLDESKIEDAVEESQPYLAALNTFIFVLLHYV